MTQKPYSSMAERAYDRLVAILERRTDGMLDGHGWYIASMIQGFPGVIVICGTMIFTALTGWVVYILLAGAGLARMPAFALTMAICTIIFMAVNIILVVRRMGRLEWQRTGMKNAENQ